MCKWEHQSITHFLRGLDLEGLIGGLSAAWNFLNKKNNQVVQNILIQQ